MIKVKSIFAMAAALSLLIATASADSLYIGDGSDNTVKRFDAETGKYLGVFVTATGCPSNPSYPPAGCLYGPTGLIFDRGHLLVNNQNVGLPVNGAIFEYQQRTGRFIRPLVAASQSWAPPVLRGIILCDSPLCAPPTIFVPSIVDANGNFPGIVQAFNAGSGFSRGSLELPPANLVPPTEFGPRGVVIGPDNLLYVSNLRPPFPGVNGDVLRYDPRTMKFKDVFVSNATCVCDFNRPEGLVFGPDGNLYVTSFRAEPGDPDRIQIFAGPSSRQPAPGTKIGEIILDPGVVPPGDPTTQRANGQALIFGPNGALFVPISGGDPQFLGSVRRYSRVLRGDYVHYDLFVPPKTAGGPIGSAWFLTFGDTDPSTLAYTPQDHRMDSAADE